MPADFTKPNPNDKQTRRDRNANLSNRLSNTSDDIREIFLETKNDGSTQWKIVFDGGTTELLSN